MNDILLLNIYYTDRNIACMGLRRTRNNINVYLVSDDHITMICLQQFAHTIKFPVCYKIMQSRISLNKIDINISAILISKYVIYFMHDTCEFISKVKLAWIPNNCSSNCLHFSIYPFLPLFVPLEIQTRGVLYYYHHS